jgi:hypothetical protein
MAKQKETGSALATAADSTALATVPDDALGAMVDEVAGDDDGLSEISPEDIKLPVKVFNFKGVDAAGDPIPPNVFYDTVAETSARSLDLMWIKLHKTNEWREYDEDAGKSKVRCRSFDQLKGTMEDGTVRPCIGCPDAKWETVQTKDGKPKRSKRCGQVYNVFGADLATRQPCVMRFKRTSLPVIQAYLNKHHIGQRRKGNQRLNWPLYVFRCTASLKMSDDKKYAIPVLDKVGNLSAEDIALGAATVPYVNDVLLAELNKVIETDRSDESGDTSFDTDKMGGDKYAADEGQAFVDGGAA